MSPASFAESADTSPPQAPAPDDLPKAPVAAHGMTVEQVMEYALDHHPLLHARQHEVEAARARLITAGLLPNPQLVFNTATPVETSTPTDLLGRVEFTILTARKRPLREAAAEADVQRTRCVLARETELVLAEAADAALEVLYLQELVALQSELGQLAAKAAEIVMDRFKGGARPYSGAILSELDASNLQLARLNSTGRLGLARIRLSRAVGLKPSQSLSVQGMLAVTPVPSIPLETLLAEAEQSRPDLAESRAALIESQRQLDLAYAQAWPDINLGPRMNAGPGANGDKLGARLAVDLPVFDRNQGGIAERAAQLRTRSAILDVTEISSLGDVASAYVELKAIQSRLDYYQTRVQRMLQDAEATIRESSAEKVLDPAQIAEMLERLVRMRLDEINLRHLHARLRTRLEILLGQRLEELQP